MAYAFTSKKVDTGKFKAPSKANLIKAAKCVGANDPVAVANHVKKKLGPNGGLGKSRQGLPVEKRPMKNHDGRNVVVSG
jgi:hypothetical protein